MSNTGAVRYRSLLRSSAVNGRFRAKCPAPLSAFGTARHARRPTKSAHSSLPRTRPRGLVSVAIGASPLQETSHLLSLSPPTSPSPILGVNKEDQSGLAFTDSRAPQCLRGVLRQDQHDRRSRRPRARDPLSYIQTLPRCHPSRSRPTSPGDEIKTKSGLISS